VTPVPRIGRVLDLVGLVLLLVGGLVYARAWLGFRDIDEFERPEHGTVMAATEFADGFRRMEHLGVAIMLVGVGVFATAWWVTRRVRSSRTAPAG
jgi:hypothetical protein